MKKILSLILTLTLALGAFSFASFAAETGTITIENSTKDKVYQIYRIFDLEYTEENGTKLYTYTVADNFKPFFAGKTDAQAVAMIAALDSDSEELDAFAAEVKEYVLKNNIDAVQTVYATTEETVVQGLPLGYYLVYPQGGLTAACSLTTTAPNAEIKVKSEYPDIEKKIVEDEEEKDLTSAKIGDSVNFKLTSRVPDITGYTVYNFTVTDTLSKGLTFNDDLALTIGGTPISKGNYAFSTSTDANGATVLELSLPNLTTTNSAWSTEEVVITYSATLNSDAVVGAPGNPNRVNLTYSNDPKNSTSFVTTPDDIVYVFTLSLDLLKVDAADETNKLAGAVFSLWTTTPIAGATEKTYPETGEDQITLYFIASGQTNDLGTLSFNLKEGTYYLFEDQAPENFNKLTQPIIFTATADYDYDSLLFTGVAVNNPLLISTNASGHISATIENRSGLELPSTGGIGTRVFMGVGSALMLAAGFVLFSYMKKQKKDNA